MIRTESLTYQYGESGFALRVPDLTIAAGEKVAVIGPSGSGKSTLLSLLAGVLLPTAGTVHFNDQQIDQLSESQRRKIRSTRIGFVFQGFELIEHLTVRDNISLPCILHPQIVEKGDLESRIRQLSTVTKIGDKLQRHPSRLSHGERQRVALCRALVTNPELVLADEPTASLDRSTAGEVIEILVQQTSERQATLVMVTHDQSLLSRFDRVISLEESSAAVQSLAMHGGE